MQQSIEIESQRRPTIVQSSDRLHLEETPAERTPGEIDGYTHAQSSPSRTPEKRFGLTLPSLPPLTPQAQEHMKQFLQLCEYSFRGGWTPEPMLSN